MKVAFPIPKNGNGDEFTDIQAQQAYFANEANGYFLLGKNRQWHGGVHVTEKGASYCINLQPIRAVADGKVVAYRMSEALQESELPTILPGNKLVYSNNFCLIQHDYKAVNSEDTSKSNEMRFYSLYMHLAPLVLDQFAEKEITRLSEASKRSLY